MKLLVGLGNPGQAYASNRHNVGFLCLNHFARAQGLSFSQRQARSLVARGSVAGVEVILAKPRTFMNESGKAVAALVGRERIDPADLIVIYDDLDLPLGQIRIRPRGSAGGHKGMQSIIQALGSQDFPRIRVGIGRPEEGGEAVSYVLGNFAPQERPAIQEAIATVGQALITILSEGLEKAMSLYNRPASTD